MTTIEIVLIIFLTIFSAMFIAVQIRTIKLEERLKNLESYIRTPYESQSDKNNLNR